MAAAKEAAKASVKAEYIQRGEALDYQNTTDAVIPCGTVVAIGGRVGVTGGEIKPGGVGSLHMAGVFRIPKTGTGDIGMGTAVYFDGAGITDAESDGAASNPTAYIPAGYAAAPALAADNAVLVKLLG